MVEDFRSWHSCLCTGWSRRTWTRIRLLYSKQWEKKEININSKRNIQWKWNFLNVWSGGKISKCNGNKYSRLKQNSVVKVLLLSSPWCFGLCNWVEYALENDIAQAFIRKYFAHFIHICNIKIKKRQLLNVFWVTHIVFISTAFKYVMLDSYHSDGEKNYKQKLHQNDKSTRFICKARKKWLIYFKNIHKNNTSFRTVKQHCRHTCVKSHDCCYMA